MMNNFIDLLTREVNGRASRAEHESLISLFMQMMMGNKSEGITPYAPAEIGTDVDKLDGQDGSFYQNATSINAGTLHTDRFSAYNDLIAESKTGTGAAQVAVGNHSHGGTVSGNLTTFIDGALAVLTDAATWVAPYAGTINIVYAVEEENGSANSTTIDIHKNGTTIFTTQANRPSIAHDDADSVASGTPDVTSFAAGDVFSLDIDAIATGAAGLGVVIAMSYVNTDTPKPRQVIFTVEGDLVVAIGKLLVKNNTGATLTIQKVVQEVSNAPAGSAITTDIHKNGTTIFTTQSNRAQIAAGAFSGNSATIENDQWADGEYLTMDVDEIGSVSPGSNLVVCVVYL